MYINTCTYVHVLNSTILHVKIYKDICVSLLLRPCQGDWACFFFAQAGEKQNTCVRIKIVVYLVNDEKIYTYNCM